MDLDDSFSRAKALFAEIESRQAQIETEQDARLQIINRMLTEVLGWDFADIKTEPHSPSGYTDYLLSSAGRRQFVIEAKRQGSIHLNTLNPTVGAYKVGGPALQDAAAGVKQAANYCLDHGVNFAALTTGTLWIGFLPFPGQGVSYLDGKAFLFPTADSIIKDFATFHDLFSKSGVAANAHNLQFAKAGGLTSTSFEPLTSANRVEYISIMRPSKLAEDLEPIFKEFFGALSSESDREMLIECFVESRESRFADASLEKMVRSISGNIAQLGAPGDDLLAKEIEAAVETGRGETVVLVGNDGAGKSTFMERFFQIVLEPSVRAQCAVIRVDIKESNGDLNTLADWLTKRVKTALEKAIFDEGVPTYEQLQGIYWREYQRWMKAEFKNLYETDKTAFKIKFGEYLHPVACTRFRRHRVRCFDGAGGASWRGGSLRVSSSLRRCA